MLSIILKDLSIFSNSRRYRLIQYIIVSILIIIFFISLTEFYSSGIDNQNGYSVNPGYQTYSLFILCLLFITFLVPRHAIETLDMEIPPLIKSESLNVGIGNITFLNLSKLTGFDIIIGKITGVVIWTLWSVWFLIPIFSLSSYIGGYSIWHLTKCGIILTINSVLFCIIGYICGLCFSTTTAKGVSYGIVLFITFLPTIPFFPFNIGVFDNLSSLTGLSSILNTNGSYLWIYNSGFYLILSLLLFPILLMLFKKRLSMN